MSDRIAIEKTINIYNVKLIYPAQLAGYHIQVITTARDQPYFEIKITGIPTGIHYKIPYLRNDMYIRIRHVELENLFNQFMFLKDNNLSLGYYIVEKDIESLLEKIVVLNYKQFLTSLDK